MAKPKFTAAAAPGVQKTGLVPQASAGAGKQAAAKPPSNTANRAVLEQQLSAIANTIYDSLLDLNVSMAALGSEWDKAINMRSRLLQMYGVPASEARPPTPRGTVAAPAAAAGMAGLPAPVMAALAQAFGGAAFGGAAFGGAAFGGAAPAATATGEVTDYKGKLQQAIGKKFKKALAKGDLDYKVEPAEVGTGYNCCLSSPGNLAALYWNEAPAPSKRAAEHGAAKAALEAEFPEMAAELGGAGMFAMGAPPAGGQKRKAPGDPVVNDDGKSKLMRSMQLILGRPVLKTDVVYTTQSTESAQGTKYTCTVTLPQYDASANYRGQAAESAKLAETKAAEVAVRALAKIVAPLEEERKAKKAKQNQEQLAKLKEATKAKKEAARAAAGQA